MTSAFHLDKWYLDAVTDDGVCVIAYRAEVRLWGVRAARVRYACVMEFAPGRDGVVRSSLRGGPEPVVEDGRVRWACPGLGVEMDMAGAARSAAGVSRRLYEGEEGVIDWRCVAPGGRVRLVMDGVERLGIGYAERVVMTVPPHRLPMRTLWWGRFVSDDAAHAAAWIRWRDGAERDVVLHDGAMLTAREVSQTRCCWDGTRGEACEVAIAPGRELALGVRGGSLLETIPLVRRLAPPIVRAAMGLRETKWAARGTLKTPGSAPKSGWVVHEVVRFPEASA